MANGGRIDYTIGFNVDKSGLNDLQKQLEAIQKTSIKEIQKFNPSLTSNEALSALRKAQLAATEVEKAMNKAFNTKLGVTNIQQLQSSLNSLNLSEIQKRFAAIGPTGQQAFLNIAKSALTTNVKLKQTSSTLSKIGETLVNTLKWSFSSSLINRFTGTITSAIGYVEHLDDSLNDIRIVTGKSADEMGRFAVQANKAAQQLGKTTTDYTEASLIYYQQGLSDQEVAARAETTLKAANVTGQSTAAVSEELTAVWNGYKVNTEQTEAAIDKLAAVAATTASDLQELSTGMSKVASAANAMGVDMDQLNAQIATIISVTRQAPESVGTALKTIYARLADLKLGDTDEDGLGLGDVSGTLDKVGIAVLDANGDLREMGDVIEDVAAKWNTWTAAQQTAIAQVMAGKRQYNNLVALFENWDMYSNALDTSRNSLGTLQKQQDIYMDSVHASIQQLKAEWEDLYDSILDENFIKGVTKGFTGILNVITNIVDALGGGRTLLTGLLALIGTKFGNQLSSLIVPFINNLKNAKTNAEQLKQVLENVKTISAANGFGDKATQAMTQQVQKMSQYWHVMTAEEINASQAATRELGEWTQRQDEIDKTKEKLEQYLLVAGSQTQQNNIKAGKHILDPNFEGSSLKSEAIVKSIEPQIEKVEQLQRSYQNFNKTINNLSDRGIKHFTTSVQAEKKVIEENEKNLKSLTTTLSVLKDNLNQAKNNKANNQFINPKEFETAEKSIQKIEQRIEALKNMPKSRGIFTDEERNTLRQVQQLISQLDNGYKGLAASAQGLEQEQAKVNEGMRQAANAAQLEEYALRQKIDSYSKLVGGISSYVFALQSLSNLGNIFSNEDLEFGEKLLQIISALVIGLPMAAGGVKNLIVAINGLMLAHGAAEATTASLTGGTKFLTKAIFGEAAAAATLQAALGPIALISLGITAAIAGLTIGSKLHQKALEREAESAKRLADQNQEYIDSLEETKSHLEELTNTYKNLQEQIDDHSISIEDARNQIYDLCKQYGLQDLAVQALTSSYENLGDAIEDANNKNQERLLEEYKEQTTLTFNASKASIKKNSSESERDKIKGVDTVDLYSATGGLLNPRNKSEGALALKDFGEQLGLDLSVDYNGHLKLDDLMKAYARNAQGLLDIITKYNDEKLFQNLEQYLGEHQDDLNTYKEAIEKQQNQQALVIANNTINKENIDSIEKYEEAKEELTETLREQTTLSDEDIDSFVEKYLNGIDKIKKYAQQADIREALMGNMSSGEDPLGLSRFRSRVGYETGQSSYREKVWYEQGGFDESQKNNIYNALEENNLLEFAAGAITEDDWKNYFLAGYNTEEIVNIIKERQEETLRRTKEDFVKNVEGLSSLNSNINSFIADSISGSIDTTSEEFVKLKENLDQVAEFFPEYADDIQVFTNEGMVGTEQWSQAAYRLQEALDSIELESLNKNFSNLKEEFENIDIDADDTELQEKLEELLDADYEISVKIHSDAEEDFLNTKAALEQVDNLAGKIGEDFIVAADDIRELNNAFPGILQGMTYMADGTIQLNEEVARSAMEMANDEALANVEATRAKLENDAKALRSKADTYDAMAQIAYRQISNEEDLEKAKTDLVAELENLELENDATATNTELQNAATVANDSQEKAGIMAGNWQEAYQVAAQAANEYGQVAAEAHNAALTGEPPSYQGNFGATYSGRSTNASEAKRANVNKVNNVSSASDLQKLGDQYTDMATSLRAQANDIEGMIATLGAKAINTAAKTGGVGTKSDSGSGGGSSEKEAKHEEYLEREEDIYREINEQLDQIESTLGRIQKINDHEWGYDAQVTLEKENKLLEEQLEKLQKKKELQVGDLSYRRKQLEDVGVNFSDDGSSMSNAEAVLNALYAHYNQMVDVYNAMSAAEQEIYKAELDAEKERIDKIDNKISDYESLYSEYQSTLDDILDKHFEQIENTVNQFNNMVEVHLELDDAKKEWTDFWYDVVKDVEENNFAEQIAKSMSKLGVLVGLGLKDTSDSQVAELTRHTAETVAEVSKQIQSAGSGGNLSIFGDDSKLAYETLKDYRDKLMTALEDAEKEVDHVGEVYLQILDDAQDKIDKQVESWSAIGDQLQNNIDLITLVSGDDSYAALAKQFELQYNNNLELVETQRRSKEYWQQEIDKYKSLLASTKEGSKEWKTYSAALEKSTENFKNAVKDLGDTVQKSIEELYKWKKSQIAELEDAFDKGLSNGMGLSDLEDEWSLINESADRYFDQVERSLAMEDINLTFDKLLNNTSLTAEAQKELNKLRDEEISRLEEKDKLNQFDIDELKARLEITKQQMALEDAQRAKTNLRLRRDSQGNYSYQYTADESQVADQAEGLLSAKKDWYELVKKRQLDLYNSALDIRKRLSEKYKELNETDWTNNLEGRQRLLEEIKRLEQLEVDIMRDAEDAKQLFFKGTADYFKEVEDAGMFPQWQSTLMKMGLAWNDGGSDSFIGTVNAGISQSEQLVLDFGDRVNEILTRAGIDYANLRDNGIDPTIDALDDLTDSNEELAESLDETNALLDQQTINLKQVEEAYNALKTAAVEAVESANNVLEELSKTAIETQQQVQASVRAAEQAASVTAKSYYSNKTTNTGGGTTGNGGGSAITTKMYKIETHPNGAFDTIAVYRKKGFSWEKWYIDGGLDTHRDDLKRRLSTKGITKDNTEGYTFRSGGYTGTWGGSNSVDELKSGRLAVLHQKELVLNEEDTKNLLNAVNILRGISINQVAEGIIAASRAASTAINGVGAGLMQTIAGLTQNVQSGDTNTYSRNMTVNADFSGVKSAEAIYQALMELDNYGMQNAYSNAPHMNRAY